MRDIKSWLEKTGLPVVEGFSPYPLSTPYIVFLENREMDGADSLNMFATRSITVELYVEKIDLSAESEIEKLLDTEGIHYEKENAYVSSEKYWETIYTFDLVEAI